jgi:hypothetical protein
MDGWLDGRMNRKINRWIVRIDGWMHILGEGMQAYGIADAMAVSAKCASFSSST